MKYAQHRSSFSKTSRPASRGSKFLKIIILILAIVLVGLVIYFIVKKPLSLDQSDNSSTPALTNEPSQPVETPVAAQPAVENTATDQIDSITLSSPDGQSFTASAKRGTSGNLFTHVIVADLPQIDLNSKYYEGWLVEPGVTDFFSTGEMFAREDGKFGLVWEKNVDVDELADMMEFSKVIITLEQRDGNAAPSATHILEGQF